MLRLFEHPLSPYARKVKIVLEQKGVPYQPIFVTPFDTGAPAFQEFLAASPYCAKFREEDSSRGGGGVTLVELC